MKYHLKNKVVWLTGASKGIGYHLATALIQAGAQLIVSARDTSVIADMPASDLGGHGPQVGDPQLQADSTCSQLARQRSLEVRHGQ